MGVPIDDLRARLNAIRPPRVAKRPADEDHETVEEMFLACQREAMSMGINAARELTGILRAAEPEEPLPIEKEAGRRYCRRCGAHKRATSFDEGSDECRSHGSRPSRPASAA